MTDETMYGWLAYGGIAVALLGARYIGKVVDKVENRRNPHVVWKTGSIDGRTRFQSIVLGLVGGPIVWALTGCQGGGQIFWCIGGMAAAPYVVDFVKPSVTLKNQLPAPVVNRIMRPFYIAAIVITTITILLWIGAYRLTASHWAQQSCGTSKCERQP